MKKEKILKHIKKQMEIEEVNILTLPYFAYMFDEARKTIPFSNDEYTEIRTYCQSNVNIKYYYDAGVKRIKNTAIKYNNVKDNEDKIDIDLSGSDDGIE